MQLYVKQMLLLFFGFAEQVVIEMMSFAMDSAYLFISLAASLQGLSMTTKVMSCLLLSPLIIDRSCLVPVTRPSSSGILLVSANTQYQ